MHVAADAASLDVLAPGRVLLGIGAGHTPREWSDIGQGRSAPAARAGRLAEFAEVTARLLRGETVTHDGPSLALRDARLDDLPTGDRVQLVVGGGHPEVLRAGARYGDVVGLAGLGRTLPDGHRHEVRWSPADLDRMLRLVHDEAQQAGRTPVIEALVQVVTVTPDRAAAVQELASRFESSAR